jgi:arginyl-tRNA synthetase
MKTTIERAIAGVLQELEVSSVPFTVEHPADIAHGDYASNVALVAAKQLGKNPRALAEEIVAKLGDFEVSIAGPGFINFKAPRDFFAQKVSESVTRGDMWGAHDTLAGKTYFVEYTDPNPFKEFHIGHLFTNSVGESLSRLMQFSGADTKRLCYQGDVGMHVANAVWGMQQMGLTPESDFTARDLGKAYALGATAYKGEDELIKTAIKALNKKIYERSDEEINALYDKGREVSLAYFETIYAIVGTKFDEYFFESEAGPKGKELVLDHPDVFADGEAGAKVFLGEEYGLHTRVFLNAEGLPTYEAKELALAKMKEDRLGASDHSIISTANEINEYFKVLKKAMSFVYPDLERKTEHIGHGTVRLTTGKMSSRTGDVIAAIDFIEEIADTAQVRIKEASPDLGEDRELAQQIALGAIKYATLKGNILQDTVFDKEEALSFEGASGPYLQYTHARICSVLQKAAEKGVAPSADVLPEMPYTIEQLLYRFEEVTVEALADRAPHKVAQYMTELAGAFNTFYAQEKIADSADQYAPYKALVAQSVAQTLKNGLWLLGVEGGYYE